MKRTFAIGLLALLVCSCVHPVRRTNQAMASWQGATSTQLLMSWGPPTQILQDGPLQVYVYTQTITTTQPATETIVNAGTIARPRPVIVPLTPATTNSYSKYRMFWIDADGRIVKWSWKGL